MKALVKKGVSDVGVREWPVPTPKANEVLIQVAVSGICRTDLYAVQNEIKTIDPLIPGHEFSGTIVACGSHVSGWKNGQRVTANPWREGGAFLGVDFPGSFAEYVCVPQNSLILIPTTLDWHQAAYCEPIAAALAVTKVPLIGQGVIYGGNRIASLTARVLRACGIDSFIEVDGISDLSSQNGFDWAIETLADGTTASALLNALKTNGTLIVKSRQPRAVGIDFKMLVEKEITIRAVNYGSFAGGLELLAENRLNLDGLIGPTYALDDWQQAFSAAMKTEDKKVFLEA